MWPVGFNEVAFQAAIDFFKEKIGITKDEWEKLSKDAKDKAFTVAGVAQLDVIHDVWKAIDKAIEDGTTFKDFQDEVKDKLESAWAGTVANPAWRMETIFRTNVQTAYSAGRYAQMTTSEVLDARPYWMFDAIMDDRTTKICKACDGTILPADDPWWKTRIPPLHHNCRSTVITLDSDQAAEFGITEKPPPNEPDGGFGAPPGAAQWEPNPDDYPPELWKEYQRKNGQQDEVP